MFDGLDGPRIGRVQFLRRWQGYLPYDIAVLPIAVAREVVAVGVAQWMVRL